MYLAVGLTKIISKGPDWGKKVPNGDEEEHDSEEGRNLHVEQVKVLVQVMKLFVIETVWKAIERAGFHLVISFLAELGYWKTLHRNLLVA